MNPIFRFCRNGSALVVSAVAALIFASTTARAADDSTAVVKPRDLSAWRSPTGEWEVVGAVVLNGANPGQFSLTPGQGVLLNGRHGRTVDLITQAEFGDVEVHIEFCIPQQSNSGVYLMGRYEVQVYDSHGIAKDKYPGIECGGIYPRWTNDRGEFEGHSPRVNVSRPAGEWQTFDITFRAPRFDAAGRKTEAAEFVKVVHNGQVVHENVVVNGPTRAAHWEDETGLGPLLIQGDHGPIAIRNLVITRILTKRSRRGGQAPASAKILEYTNPVWDGYLADPQVLKTGGEYYAYGTGPEHQGRQFPVLHSKDFANWTFVGNALETLADPKVKAYWAPEVAEKDGRFYLYYAGEYQMRVAVADHPAGPFKNAGRILFPDEPFSIDGHPYRDPKTGKWFMFFAKDFLDQRVGTALAVAELSDDMISTTGPIKTVLRAVGDWQIYEKNRTMYGRVFDAWHTVEAPFVVLRDGRYYCFYSGGNWQTPGYGVGVAVSDAVMGPYKDEANLEGATVLKSIPGKLIGPGHNSVILGPDNRTHFIVYHSWNPERTKRQMCLDPIEWAPQGPRAFEPSRGRKSVPLQPPADKARQDQ